MSAELGVTPRSVVPPAESSPADAASARRRSGALLVLLAACALLIVPLRVVGYGWLPQDDVRRHVAKAIADKPWSEILVLRPEARLDEHPGWHAVLGAVHRAGIETPRGLAVVSIVALAALFLVPPLFRFALPEAWLAALAVVALFEPAFYPRLLSGRPLVFAMAALALLAASWERLAARGKERLGNVGWTGVALLFALVVWIHGNWYLWLLPLAAFLVAGERWLTARLAVALAGGSLVGAVLTGQPVAFLVQAVEHLFWSFGTSDETRQLATEFQPGTIGPALVLAVALLLVWRRGMPVAEKRSDLAADPLFLLAAAGWVLGLAVSRFWTDWGLPALAVWMARELEAAWAPYAAGVARRAAAVALTAAVLVLAVTGNRGDRWSSLEGERHLRLDDPSLAGWLPQPGGILYSNSMGVFYDTFFENPRADFRYVLGFEPGLMPAEDLAVFREIQRSGKADEAFLPWAAKLRPIDRLVIARPGGAPPHLAGLEWVSPFAGVWIGRTPR